eukprot:Plantae.Rhodophyta-Purpureofilum_apyrenoidigerum.ctg6117.p1 GENE.Plantae.Rhodophyta-Purpureofilum_apyrenoidigerum.ctg6117~~Plantae.Rhodophyta-Purpureofilum_apyrenoidigerum.ctg6117.p1  ORF type:complete len:431 (-),score=88.28 Plantae.Rhodophyta-Purpureofilum_apyrenoidigerum.ctg6117:292-1584(-)
MGVVSVVVVLATAVLAAGAAGQCLSLEVKQKLVAPNSPKRGFFGSYVTMSEDTMLVSGFGEDNFKGAVNVFVLENGDWKHQQRLVASDRQNGDHFGWEAGIRGDRVVVGAAFKRANKLKTGKAYIFERSSVGANFKEVAMLNSPEKENENHFGYSVNINNNFVFIGTEMGLVPSSAKYKAGAVHIYTQSGNKWSLFQSLRGENDYDEFGDDVRLGGGFLVIGAPFAESSSTAKDSGATYVYRRNKTGRFARFQKLTAPGNTANSDHFGTANAISPSGQTITCGADRGPGPNSDDQGALYIFNLINGKFVFTQKLSPVDGKSQDRFGYRMAIRGGVIAVSAWAVDRESRDTGAFYVYALQDGTWKPIMKYYRPNGTTDERFGLVIGINSKYIVATNSREDSNRKAGSTKDTGLDDGAVYVFEYKRNDKDCR